MCHSRSLNNKFNHIHDTTLHTVYQDFQSNFLALLSTGNSFIINQKYLQLLAIETFKVRMNIFLEIMNKIFNFSKISANELRIQ